MFGSLVGLFWVCDTSNSMSDSRLSSLTGFAANSEMFVAIDVGWPYSRIFFIKSITNLCMSCW